MDPTILSVFIFIIPAIVGLYFRKGIGSILSVVLIITAISGLIDVVTFFQFKLGYNTSLLLNFYILPYAFMWTIPIYKSLNHKLLRKVIIILGTALGIGAIFQLSQWDMQAQFSGRTMSIAGLHIIISSLIYLFYVALLSGDFRLANHPLFFICSALLIYHSFNTVIFLFLNSLKPEAVLFLTNFRYASNIVLNLIVAAVFYYKGRYAE